MPKENAAKTPAPKGPAFSSRREAIRATRVPGETPDPTPVEIPVGNNRPLTLREEMMRFIRTEMSAQAQKEDLETFEEFDDFSIDDEETDLSSPYTVQMADEPGSYLLEPEPENASETLTDASERSTISPDASTEEPPLESRSDSEPEGRDTSAPAS